MRNLYILEGPDGGGKTTLGAKLATRLGVRVDNHGPYKGEQEIWRYYFDSMIPAYSGERSVVLDRCWIAEPIYGEVYRAGVNRIQPWHLKLLEHIARECNATVIWCLPPFRNCLEAFNSRREDEMLENEDQLRAVYGLYRKAVGRAVNGRFIHISYDYTDPNCKNILDEVSPW